VNTFLHDLRIGLRVLLKEKSFFTISVLVLALGICGVTTQFSVINSALIRGLPFPEPSRLVRVALRDPSWAPGRTRAFWFDEDPAWSRSRQTVEGVAGFTGSSFIATIGDLPERFPGSHVTEDFFSLLGVKPVMGRLFKPEDNRIEAPRVTIISDSLWNAEFGRDPNVVGRVIRLNGKPATVVGVMPPGFNFPRDQLWLPLFNEYPRGNRGAANLIGDYDVLARLKSGVTLEQANAEFTVLARQAAKDFPDRNRNFTEAVVEPLMSIVVTSDTRQLLFTMLGAVVAVLLIACVNVMNMQFARATLRARELAVRGALGASRGRLLAQMLTESLIVAVLGAGLGMLFASWAIDFYARLGTGFPAWMTFEIDGTVLAATIAATVGSLVVAGLLPAWLASRTDALDVLKQGGRGHTHPLVSRLTGALVVGQIALTAALLVASLLLVKSVAGRYALDFGFDLGSVLTGRMNFETDYHNDNDLQSVQARLLQQLRASPHFTHAAFTSRRGNLTGNFRAVQLENRPEQKITASVEIVSDGYFATLGLGPLQGREFEPGDTPNKPAPALVNATFAKKYFPGESPLGLRLRSDPNASWCTIVGIVPDTLMQGPLDAQRDGAGVFLSISASPQSYATLVVRGHAASPEKLVEPLRREIFAVNPHLAIYLVKTPKRGLDNALEQVRTVMQLFSVFGAVAIVLAAVGLYGVAAFSVSQRTPEFGIRMALGAAPREIVKMVLQQGALRFSLGGVAGLGLAFALAPVAGAANAALLYNVSPRDPAVYALVFALLASVTGLACLIPARRAAKVDPMEALRAE
jgi:putative ABC transport system permease protein